MARKESITKDKILISAFTIARDSGISEVTARKIADKAECSTQPVFRIYKNMAELLDDLFDMTVEFFQHELDTMKQDYETPFVNLGLAYIKFAIEYKNLFQMLFVNRIKDEISTYEMINGNDKGFILQEIKKIEGADRAKAGMIFSQIWIFIHGMACMTLSGDLDLDQEEIVKMLQNIYTCLKA